MTTEQEARDMQTAIEAFQLKDTEAIQAQRIIDFNNQKDWYDTTIKPNLMWNDKQTEKEQLTNSFDDRDTLEALVVADRNRHNIIQTEIKNITTRITVIKSG